MGRAMDYNGFAPTYAETRWARDFLVEPLCADIRLLSAPACVLDIGCGTGNYTRALQQRCPQHQYHGFDLSENMLQFAQSQVPAAHFALGNADVRFPYEDSLFDYAFVVDVIHHLQDPRVFFAECARVLRTGARLAIVTDSEVNVERRSLTKYFPETAQLDRMRYSPLPKLKTLAADAGLRFVHDEQLEDSIPIDTDLVEKMRRKCSSSLRLLTDAQHAQGMARLVCAMENGEHWLSSYTILRFGNSLRSHSSNSG